MMRLTLAALALTAVVFFLMTKDDPDLAQRRAAGHRSESLAAMLEPLRRAVPCAAAYMNEAHNSWIVSGLRSGAIDPYGYCH